MSIIENYGIGFVTEIRKTDGVKIPRIKTERSANGDLPNGVIGSFFGWEGVQGANAIRDEINLIIEEGIFPTSYLGPYDDEVEITNNPLEISFYPYSADRLSIPINDFIGILEEWILFLESIPFQHALSNS